MPITSGQYVIENRAQANGSRYVVETHTSSDGRVFTQQYLLPAGQGATEAQALLDIRTARWNEMLATQEAERVINGT